MALTLFPMFLKLDGRPCLVAGAGEIALAKIESLLQAGAMVTVVAPEASPQIRELAQKGALIWLREEFSARHLEGAFLAIAATNSPSLNRMLFEAAQERGVLCNSVDDPPHCDFYFPSVVQRGDLQIAISTAGDSPALAQRLRHEIDLQLPLDAGEQLRHSGKLRREVMATRPVGEDRRLLLHELARRSVCEREDCPSRQLALHGAAHIGEDSQ